MQTEIDSRLRAAPIALAGEELDAWARDRANAAATAMLESFHVDIGNGAVWLGNRRVLILQAQWFLDLRQTLIDALGHEGARAVLTRLGYAAGVRDADLSMKQHPDFETAELITTGGAFHALQGSALTIIELINSCQHITFQQTEKWFSFIPVHINTFKQNQG